MFSYKKIKYKISYFEEKKCWSKHVFFKKYKKNITMPKVVVFFCIFFLVTISRKWANISWESYSHHYSHIPHFFPPWQVASNTCTLAHYIPGNICSLVGNSNTKKLCMEYIPVFLLHGKITFKFTDWNQLKTWFYWSISDYFCIFIQQYIIEGIFLYISINYNHSMHNLGDFTCRDKHTAAIENSTKIIQNFKMAALGHSKC